jgi:hypothetical protein
MLPPFSGSRNKTWMSTALLATGSAIVSCFAYYFTLKMEWYVPPKSRLTFSGLHDVISQKIELFIPMLWESQILFSFLLCFNLIFVFLFFVSWLSSQFLSFFLPMSADLACAASCICLRLRLRILSLSALNSQKFSGLWSGVKFQFIRSSSLYFLPDSPDHCVKNENLRYVSAVEHWISIFDNVRHVSKLRPR